MVEITEKQIDVAAVLKSVMSPHAGAIVPFIGTVRDDDGITGLEYDCYGAMACRLLEKIAAESKSRWSVEQVAIVHRYGWIPVGEASVVIAVAAVHRKEAFAVCRFIIERIKEIVPIWKEGGHAQAC